MLVNPSAGVPIEKFNLDVLGIILYKHSFMD